LAQDYQVRALAQYNSFASTGWLDDLTDHNHLEIVLGDIRDGAFCRSLCQDIDIVFHLAALIAIPYSYIAPESYIDTNIKGTLNICQAARDAGVRRLLQTSTSEVYGSAQYVPIDERHPLQPQSPYSASKIGADALAMSFFYSFDMPVTIVRPFNTYGPRQSARAVIPTIISQIAAGKKQIMLGDLTPTRDFNYVTDTCRGFLALAESDQAIGETINIGTGVDVSIGEVLNIIKKLMNSDVEFICDPQRIRPEKSEVQRLCCNNKKIQKMTGFQPKVTLQDGLEKTIAWFLDSRNLAKYPAEHYVV
jgi:NAD dependent epimerase/dehydratase